MFGYFEDPFYYGYRPTYYRAYRPRVSALDRYMASVERRLEELLEDEMFFPRHGLEFEARKAALENAMKHDAEDKSDTKAKAEAEAKAQYGSDEAPRAKPKEEKKPLPYRGYFFQSRSSYNGQDYVEEHRERVTNSDGTVRTTMRRRLGDRWYENETHTDKDGKSTSKETWHNVPESDIEKFKDEWSAKHSLRHEKTEETPAVEDKSTEKPKEDPSSA